MNVFRPVFLYAFLFWCPLLLPAAEKRELSQEETEFFEKKIRPALVKHCYKCHAEEGDKVKGGLLLDTRETSLSGGDSGPAVVPFDLNESLLYLAITYEDSSLEMPPKYKLEEDVISDFKQWIEMGAPDPRDRQPKEGAPQEYTNTIDIDEGRQFWAYQAPHNPEIPEQVDANWVLQPIDHFVSQQHREKGLTPAADADARTLIRRLSFDLTGLPPSSAVVGSFVEAHNADRDHAIATAVKRLLDSPQFGERFGRHWLDVARYAESSGKEVNATFPHAWRYRDYVIDSFNADKPFDQFVLEQIAGDLLPANSAAQEAEHTVATSFLAIGTKGLNEQNARQFRFDLVDEQIDTTTQAFLATTAACARCHDHKFDPIPMSDYYAMAGIFLSSETLFGTAEALQNRKATDLIPLPAGAHSGTGVKPLAELIDLEFQKATLQENLDKLLTETREARRSGDGERATELRLQILRHQNQIGIADRILASYDDDGYPKPLSMGMKDLSSPFDSQILIRGEEDNPTDERVPRGFIQVVKTSDEEPISADESGRLQLAGWITSPENPLTARVYVNRIWSWLFGEGIVRSIDNFGSTGDEPTHPELLDYLAVRLIELDWSTKQLVQEIVTSRTYRMSSAFREDHFEKDPENHSLWRANKRRLDAEAIRDSALAVSGQLNLERPAGSLVSEAGDGFVGRNIQEDEINSETTYRSVYLPIARGLVPESLGLFDFADPSLLSGKREITTVPSQALYMMNSPFILKNAKAMASYLTTDIGLRGEELVSEAFYLCYSRPPTPGESERTTQFIERFLIVAKEEGLPPLEARLLALTTFCQSLIGSAEFRYLN
ncbi:MAG: PSD1 and planctomycete cytochrome C domain-containing protein [Verrucomicrobiales bacterium]|nr:PSD1 and planctomycete cytochrome C domain-containing protein [Verrucomicrobiales bacterium]